MEELPGILPEQIEKALMDYTGVAAKIGAAPTIEIVAEGSQELMKAYEDLERAIINLPAWVPTEVDYPPENELVLVYMPDEKVKFLVASWTEIDNYIYWIVPYVGWSIEDEVTHWKPLVPPEE